MDITLNDLKLRTYVFYCIEPILLEKKYLLPYLMNYQQQKASKFIRKENRDVYILLHAFLNRILSFLLNSKPVELEFYQNTYGKPYLKENSVFFNISHSGKTWAIALSGNDEVGIDIESISNVKGYKDIVSSYFHSEEITYINNSNDDKRAFFYLWTRKEALLKAIGKGIDEGLNKFCAIDQEVCFDTKRIYITSKKIDDVYLSVAQKINTAQNYNIINNENYSAFFC